MSSVASVVLWGVFVPHFRRPLVSGVVRGRESPEDESLSCTGTCVEWGGTDRSEDTLVFIHICGDKTEGTEKRVTRGSRVSDLDV